MGPCTCSSLTPQQAKNWAQDCRYLSEGDLGNVNVLSSWNPSGSKVVLDSVYHGVRSSKIKLFTRDEKGKFVPINLTLPDPLLDL